MCARAYLCAQVRHIIANRAQATRMHNQGKRMRVTKFGRNHAQTMFVFAGTLRGLRGGMRVFAGTLRGLRGGMRVLPGTLQGLCGRRCARAKRLPNLCGLQALPTVDLVWACRVTDAGGACAGPGPDRHRRGGLDGGVQFLGQSNSYYAYQSMRLVVSLL